MNELASISELNSRLVQAQEALTSFESSEELTEDEAAAILLDMTGSVADLESRIEECRKQVLSTQEPPPQTPEASSRSETEPTAGHRTIEELLRCAEKLPKLTQEQREATFGGSLHHSAWFRENAPDFHANGDLWPDEKLQKFFDEGLKNHYFAESLKEYLIDISYNHSQFLKAEEQKDLIEDKFYLRIFKKQLVAIAKNLGIQAQRLSDEELVRTIVPIAHRLIVLAQKVEFPKELIQLGGYFQKKKVCIEKAANMLSIRSEDPEGHAEELAQLQTQVLANDREAEQAQQIIYHWIDECAQQFRAFAVKNAQDPAADFSSFSFQMPEFLKQ